MVPSLFPASVLLKQGLEMKLEQAYLDKKKEQNLHKEKVMHAIS